MLNLSNQEKITIIFLLVVIIIALGLILYKNYNVENNFTINPSVNSSTNTLSNTSAEVEIPSVIVHVSGAVKNPGVFQLKFTDRVVDAVQIAGGAFEEANLDAINLAAPLKDGQKITIPYKVAEIYNEEDDKAINKNFINTYSSPQTSAEININTANDSILQTLPGIGPVLSERIINYRNQNGLFGSIDEIKNVSGIGEKKFEGIKDLICTQ